MQRKITRNEEIAWAAGLFEGEGCWNAYVRRSGKIQAQARLSSTDQDVVEKFARIVGIGNVTGPRQNKNKPQWKPVYEWCVYEIANVRALIEMFRPWMGERRLAKAEEVLVRAIDVLPHNAKKTHCPKGHEFTDENTIREVIYNRNGKAYEGRRCRTCRREAERNRARRRLGITEDRFRV